MFPSTFLLLFLGLGRSVFGEAIGESIVNVKGVGFIKGSVQSYTDTPNKTYYQYLGIPYGQADRFQVAVPAGPLGEFDATQEGKVCPQPTGNVQFPGGIGEACLVLSVAAPQDPNALNITLKPVVVFIHGGAFIIGTSRKIWYDPELLVAEGVVVVQPNYRLGAFGFITDGNIIPKNIGLKDVRCALRWVQANIKSFGGDPNRVTIYGESAGSAIVSTFWFSKEQDLFHAVVMQSGVAIAPWVIQKQEKIAYFNMLKKTTCAYTISSNASVQVACLKRLSVTGLNVADLVVLGINDFVNVKVLGGFDEAIVMEDPSDPDAIVTQNPLEQLKSGKIRIDIPLIISITSLEMLSFLPEWEALRTKSNADIVPYGMMPKDPNFVGGLIKTRYAGSELGWAATLPTTYNAFLGDVFMNFPARYFVKFALHVMSQAPIYVMQFSYASLIGRLNIPGTSNVGHADDLCYTWKYEFVTKESIAKFSYPPEAFAKRKQYNTMLGNFIKYHNPTPDADPDLQNIIWPAAQDSDHFKYLDFDRITTIQQDLKDDNYLFWLQAYEKYGTGRISL